LAAIETASVAVVTLAYAGVRLPPGSGLLVGAQEGLAVKGVTLTSQKWPGWPPGLVLLRASVGRVGETRDLQRSDDELVALVRSELRTLLGIASAPIDALVTRWGGGLPQYGIGHVDRVARIRRAVAAVPGLAVCGAAYDGLGIPACIGSARAAAAQACAAFAQTGQ
jgi:oxygen-dependent protoporphyrinogen oxidase